MNALRIVWHAHFTSLRNASRYNARTRVAASILIIFNIGVSFWSIPQLLTRLHQWQVLGQATLNTNLWLLCIDAWIGMSLFSIIGMLRAMGSDETLLLFTLPIPSATRFRIFYSTFFIQNLWNWLLLEVGCIGYVLTAALGVQGLLWLLLLQCGTAVSVSCALILALLFIRYVLFPEQVKTRIITIALCVALGLVLALSLFSQARKQEILQGSLSLAHLNPVLVLFLLLGVFLVIIGPLSEHLGNLYTAAFRSIQSGGNAKNAFTLPGIHLINSIIARRSSVSRAFFVKSLLNQSRNWFFWLRIILVVVLIALFPLVHLFINRYGVSTILQVVAYASGVVVWHVLEVAPSAISGEANRLTLYLIAPLKLSQIIRAKLVLFILPLLIEGSLITLFLSWQVRLSLGQLWFVLSAVSCVIAASIALPVLGSAWDEDLEVTVEGRVQAILQEEAPVSPKRIGLLNITVMLSIGMMLLLWKMSAIFALASLAGIVVVVLIGMWRFSTVYIQKKLVQK